MLYLHSHWFVKDCKFDIRSFGISDQVSQHARTVRFIKFRVETFYGRGGGLGYLSFDGFLKKQDCRCNGKTVHINKDLLDGECHSVRRFEAKNGVWKNWCYVDKEEKCGDTVNGWSFKACIEGQKIFLIKIYNIFSCIKVVQTLTLYIIILKMLLIKY